MPTNNNMDGFPPKIITAEENKLNLERIRSTILKVNEIKIAFETKAGNFPELVKKWLKQENFPNVDTLIKDLFPELENKK